MFLGVPSGVQEYVIQVAIEADFLEELEVSGKFFHPAKRLLKKFEIELPDSMNPGINLIIY